MAVRRYAQTSLLCLFLVSVVIWGGLSFAVSNIPPAIHLTVESETVSSLSLPLLVTARLTEPAVVDLVPAQFQTRSVLSVIDVHPVSTGNTQMMLFAFDLIPLRSVSVKVRPTMDVALGGHAIGVLATDIGLSVASFTDVRAADGEVQSPAAVAGVKAGDVVRAADGMPVMSNHDLTVRVMRAGQLKRPVELTVVRGSSLLTIQVHPFWCQQLDRYTIGIQVRGGSAGVGTLTFYDPVTMRFAALGHPLGDVPIGRITGRIVRALVSGVQQSQRGRPGEKIGVFIEPGKELGLIEMNSPYGIMGRLLQPPPEEKVVPVATISEVEIGPAVLYTVIDGQRIEQFAVEIIRTNLQSSPADRGFVVKITDDRLLASTGGIVQGMSGSPVVQNGRLVGAITHVFVNDPTRGYGVYAEWMVELCIAEEAEVA